MGTALDPGAEVGHLRIERQVGRGAFATVYLAEDRQLGRWVALKVLEGPPRRDAEAALLRSFLEEARVIARLESPHVVTLYSLREGADGGVMLEMEFAPEGTLEDLLQQGALAADRTEAILRGTLAGLGAAHDGGVLHRDVKPGNILLVRGEAKLTDFGLARVMGDDVELDEGPMGTPYYMAPEALGGAAASVQSDLWSVGVVAHQMLAGHHPFPAPDVVGFFVAVENNDPTPLPAALPERLRLFVARCLEKDPARRPASCAEALALLDERPGRSEVPSVAPRPEPVEGCFQGREDERARAEAVLRSPGSHVVVVAGAAGIGKTALCEALAQRMRGEGMLWMDAHLSAVEGPLVTLVRAARTADPLAESAGAGASGGRPPPIEAILAGDEMPSLDSPQQALWALEHLLEGAAEERPLVLCVDDAQHASEEDLEFLGHLARRLSGRRFTLVVATRPDAIAAAGFPAAERIDLDGLDEASLFALLEERLGATLPGDVAARIHARTEGNPLYALELIRHLEDTGALERRGAQLLPTDSWHLQSIPARLRDLVRARLTTLDDEDRSLLEVAAIDGVEFDGRAVAAVQGMPVLQVLRRLQALSRRRTLIGRAHHGYRFADRVTQEVLYEDMAPELRVEIHRSLAEHLQTREGDADPSRIGRHWERCGERQRAAPHLLRVAEGARRRQEFRRLIEFGERAGVLDDPPLVDLCAHEDLTLGMASALLRRGDYERSRALFERMLGAAEERGDPALVERISVYRATATLVSGRRPEGNPSQWERIADRCGDTLDGARARAVVGRLAKIDGRLEDARRAFEAADRVFAATGSDWLHSMMQDQLGSVAMRAERLEEARSYYAVAAEVADRLGVTHNAAVSRLNAALAHMLAGHVDGVGLELRRSIRVLELAGASVSAAQAGIFLAEALYAGGNTTGAIQAIEEALPTLIRGRHGGALTNAWRLQAELLAVQDRLGEARASIERALEAGEASGDRSQRVVARAVAALIATAEGRTDDASRAVDAMATLAPDGTAGADGAVLVLSEAVLEGLPADRMETVGYLARSDLERHLREATLCHARGEACDRHVEGLSACRIGLRRASYRLLTDRLAAASHQRQGHDAEAARHRDAARRTATLLGHRRALRWLSGSFPPVP